MEEEEETLFSLIFIKRKLQKGNRNRVRHHKRVVQREPIQPKQPTEQQKENFVTVCFFDPSEFSSTSFTQPLSQIPSPFPLLL
jgi:hypothetical protein